MFRRFFGAQDILAFFVAQVGGIVGVELDLGRVLRAELQQVWNVAPRELTIATVTVELSLLMTYLYLSQTRGHEAATQRVWHLQTGPMCPILIAALTAVINDVVNIVPQAFRGIRHQYNEVVEGIGRLAQANIPTIHGNRF